MTTLVMLIALAQFPASPDKSPPLPQKTTPSPQASLATPQTSYVPQQDYTPVVQRAILQVPSSYVIQRQIITRAPVVQYQAAYDVADMAPVSCDIGMGLAYAGQGCGVQQAVVQRNVISHNVVVSHGLRQQAVVNHAVGVGVGRQPRKVVTKQVTKTKRGLFGGLFGG